jgi:alpha-ketoglutarate-dependent dioxygenase FTO
MNPIKKVKGSKRKREGNPTREEQGPSSTSDDPTVNQLYLSPEDGVHFENHLQDHYKGFVHLPVDRLEPRDFHQEFKNSLERLRDAGYYQYDVVMAGGKYSSRTFVKRTLVGNPGITYKYLGLRLFAHAWSGPGSTPLMKSIGDMNQSMIKMTEQFPENERCDYNLTLINYMEPTTHTKVGFKDEANYDMGKVSVSWHADSSLVDNSSIGVYHCLPTQRNSKWDWKIALRPLAIEGKDNTGSTKRDNNSTIPPKPVVVNTRDGDAYFLLGNFNMTHQHCVLAGSQANRISSTHRVAVTIEDTYDYILKRVKIARKRFRLQMEVIPALQSPVVGLDAKVIRYCQRILTEVEMEWIAQYWLQGDQHDKMRIWWQKPMKTLEAYWSALEVYTCRLFDFLLSRIANNDTVPIDVVKVLIIEFKTRQSFREQWNERRSDKIYLRRVSEEFRPVARPIFENNEKDERRLPKDLTSAIQELSMFLEKHSGGIKSKKMEQVIDDHPLSLPSKSCQSNASSIAKEETDTVATKICIKQPKEEHISNAKKRKKK